VDPRARDNLNAKLADERFISDLRPLVANWPTLYTVESGGAAVLSVLDAIEAQHTA
jgi:hypothetical protein